MWLLGRWCVLDFSTHESDADPALVVPGDAPSFEIVQTISQDLSRFPSMQRAGFWLLRETSEDRAESVLWNGAEILLISLSCSFPFTLNFENTLSERFYAVWLSRLRFWVVVAARGNSVESPAAQRVSCASSLSPLNVFLNRMVPQLTLYSARICPWAQRATLALAEVNVRSSRHPPPSPPYAALTPCPTDTAHAR